MRNVYLLVLSKATGYMINIAESTMDMTMTGKTRYKVGLLEALTGSN